MSEGGDLTPGAVLHVEIAAPDLAAAAAFYSSTFGWTTEPMGPEYTLFKYPDGSGGGGFDPTLTAGEGGAVLVITTTDITAKLAEIEANGGQKLTDRTEIGGGHGFCAYFKDPAGNKMGLWSKD